MASLPFVGYQLRLLLAPLTLRGKPLPAAAKIVLAVGAGALLVFGAKMIFEYLDAVWRRLKPLAQTAEYEQTTNDDQTEVVNEHLTRFFAG